MMVLQGRRTFVGSEILYAEYRTAIMLLYYRSRFKKICWILFRILREAFIHKYLKTQEGCNELVKEL